MNCGSARRHHRAIPSRISSKGSRPCAGSSPSIISGGAFLGENEAGIPACGTTEPGELPMEFRLYDARGPLCCEGRCGDIDADWWHGFEPLIFAWNTHARCRQLTCHRAGSAAECRSLKPWPAGDISVRRRPVARRRVVPVRTWHMRSVLNRSVRTLRNSYISLPMGFCDSPEKWRLCQKIQMGDAQARRMLHENRVDRHLAGTAIAPVGWGSPRGHHAATPRSTSMVATSCPSNQTCATVRL